MHFKSYLLITDLFTENRPVEQFRTLMKLHSMFFVVVGWGSFFFFFGILWVLQEITSLVQVQSIHDLQLGIKTKHSVRYGHWLSKAASHRQHPLP